MPEKTIAPMTYLTVCVILVLLTFVTVGVSFMHVPSRWHVFMGLSIGVIKASLVILFFMHVLISPRVTWIFIMVVTFWFVFVFLVLTLDDYLTRGLLPFSPGH
jgi:cytochrome c oxidase subunit 4